MVRSQNHYMENSQKFIRLRPRQPRDLIPALTSASPSPGELPQLPFDPLPLSCLDKSITANISLDFMTMEHLPPGTSCPSLP